MRGVTQRWKLQSCSDRWAGAASARATLQMARMTVMHLWPEVRLTLGTAHCDNNSQFTFARRCLLHAAGAEQSCAGAVCAWMLSFCQARSTVSMLLAGAYHNLLDVSGAASMAMSCFEM